MRKGKTYTQVLPQAMAPDMTGFSGYPWRFEAFLNFRYAGRDFGIGMLPNDIDPVVDVKTLSVEYRWKGTAGLEDFGVRFKVRSNQGKPGVTVTCGVLDNHGSLALVEQSGDLRVIGSGFSGLVRIDQPFDTELYQGLFEKVYLTWVQGIPRKLLPPSNR